MWFGLKSDSLDETTWVVAIVGLVMLGLLLLLQLYCYCWHKQMSADFWQAAELEAEHAEAA